MAQIDAQKHCSDRAFYSYGTSRIFEQRAEKLAKLRNWITFLGIAVPLSVGSIVLSFGAMPTALPYVLFIAGIIGTAQLTLSAWSLVARWDEKYSYAVNAMQANTGLYNSWDSLLKRPPPNLDARIQELETEYKTQERTDMAQHITTKEKRFAMRSALFYTAQKCATCDVKPTSMQPSNCDTCGNF